MATEAATRGSTGRALRRLRRGRSAPHLAVGGEMGDEGLIPTTKEFGTALADIVRCGACGHMQLDRFPSEAELDAAYEVAESDAYVEEEAGQRYSFASVLERIERYAPRRGAILDVGCWVGFLLAEAGAGLERGDRDRAVDLRLRIRARATRTRRADRGAVHRRPSAGTSTASSWATYSST